MNDLLEADVRPRVARREEKSGLAFGLTPYHELAQSVDVGFGAAPTAAEFGNGELTVLQELVDSPAATAQIFGESGDTHDLREGAIHGPIFWRTHRIYRPKEHVAHLTRIESLRPAQESNLAARRTI
jgi:hypothetical protein